MGSATKLELTTVACHPATPPACDINWMLNSTHLLTHSLTIQFQIISTSFKTSLSVANVADVI